MNVITFPLMKVTDDSGSIVAGATVAITSVRNKAQVDIASHGAVVNAVDGSNVLTGSVVSVDYDPEAHGEAWIDLAISKVGSTFSGTNATPSFYLPRDSGRVLACLPAAGVVPADMLKINSSSTAAANLAVEEESAVNLGPVAVAVWANSGRSLTDKAGFSLAATGLNLIAGFRGWNFPQMLRALVAAVIGKRVGVPASGTAGTVTYSDAAPGDYGTLTVDVASNITTNAMTPPV